jgi:NDP-sugar pyrophosphorylase family protein
LDGSPTASWNGWRRGVGDVVECIGHLGDEIISSLGDGARFGLSVTYSRIPTQPTALPGPEPAAP